MINVLINGETTQTSESYLGMLLKTRYKDGASFAVAVNEFFIAKKNYPTFELNEGDKIEIVEPMQGG